MSIILNIDTSTEIASVSIADNGVILASVLNAIQKEHASFLHNAVKDVFSSLSLNINNIDAIAVTNGPGSYTGLRVGMASAKGFCYALNKPLITVGTLNAMATAGLHAAKETAVQSTLFCPMIDARRMEVYTAVFDSNMLEILPACAMVLDENSFKEMLSKNKMLFFGSGAIKWSSICTSENAGIINELEITTAINQLSYKKFINNDFTDLSYSEPLYVKEFFSP